jgi:segregation and condensation protein B
MEPLQQLQSHPPLRAIVEAILFIGSEPLTLDRLAHVAPEATQSTLEEIIVSLNALYERQQRPYRIEKDESGWRMRLLPAMTAWLGERLRPDRGVRLGRQQLEVLSIVAYRQPISRAGMEHLVHGDAGPALRQLIRRQLVEVANSGEKDSMYVTTQRFLQVFLLSSLEDLPALEDLQI